MKPTREQVIEWSREAGLAGLSQESDMTYLMRLVDQIFAAGQASVAQGVEPVATKQETQQFDCFHVSFEDSKKLKSLPVGTKLYTAPPTAAAIEGAVKEACCGLIERMRETLPKENTIELREAEAAIRSIPPIFSAQEDPNAKDAERYRVLRNSDYQLSEDDPAVSDSFFETYFGEDLDSAVDGLKARYDAFMLAAAPEAK